VTGTTCASAADEKAIIVKMAPTNRILLLSIADPSEKTPRDILVHYDGAGKEFRQSPKIPAIAG
jgi:hypothetical protein